MDWFKGIEGDVPPLSEAGIFGIDIPSSDAQMVLLGVPVDATVSYGAGSHRAPEAIRMASHQLDLFDHHFGEAYRCGIHLQQMTELLALNEELRGLVLDHLGQPGGSSRQGLDAINLGMEKVREAVFQASRHWLSKGKLVGIIGGDHSCPLGLLEAVGHAGEAFGVLHIDAHHDLRQAYEGFEQSHASIFYNALHRVPAMERLVSVGIRDYSRDERQLAEANTRIRTFYGADLDEAGFGGEAFADTVTRILEPLPKRVYVSVDIDGLEQSFAPSTGTPVPGGLSFSQVSYLLSRLVASGRTLVGFDLVEVAPGESEWDANVGARLAYKLCGALRRSQNLPDLA